MIVLVAGADGRLGRLLVTSLIAHGHTVRGLVRTPGQAADLSAAGATPLVADLRGDIGWAAAGCDAAVFTAGARRRSELGAIDGGASAKLAEAAAHFDLRRFVLCSAVGADTPERARTVPLHVVPRCRSAGCRRRPPGRGSTTAQVIGNDVPHPVSRDSARAAGRPRRVR